MWKLWNGIAAKRSLSILLCAALALASMGVCAVSTADLVVQARTMNETGLEEDGMSADTQGTEQGNLQEEGQGNQGSAGNSSNQPNNTQPGEEKQTNEEKETEEEDTRCLYEFTKTWVGYECSLKDYVSDYEPGDEVRISASFNRAVGSQFGLYIDGAWNSFGGEGRHRNITLIPDSDYLNIQITDLKGFNSVNLTDLSVEIVKKGDVDNGSYLHRFIGLWQGFETKFSAYNPSYEPGDEVRVTVVYNKKVTSQIGFNQNGEWTTQSSVGKELVATILPENDYLNIQISDMWANYSVGILSISVEITQKGPGSGNGGWNGGYSGPMEPGYTSPNKAVWDTAFAESAAGEGQKYEQNIGLSNWGWSDIAGVDDIISQIREGALVIVDFAPVNGDAPTLQFTMTDGTQIAVQASYASQGKAGYSYDDIARALNGFLLPQEIKNIQISPSSDKDVSISCVQVIKSDTKLAQEPIKVLTDSWSGFETTVTKWNAGFVPGDTITVTVTFDKSAPGDVVFNGDWSKSSWSMGGSFSRTAVSKEDKIVIRLGEMPAGKSYVAITGIKVDIAGKKNYDNYVKMEGNSAAGTLAETKESAAKAVLTRQELENGTRLIVDIEPTTLSEEKSAGITALFNGEDSDGSFEVKVASAVDVELYKEASGGKRIQLSETGSVIKFKMPIPQELEAQAEQYEFGVVREHEGVYEFLEDKDSNPLTVTFESDRFSTFAIVYGETGAFDGAGGAIKVFREAWKGFETTYSAYCAGFQPGYPTTVTVTFDTAVKSYVDYHAPDWTRDPADLDSAAISTVYTTTIVPKDDSLSIGIADMNGNQVVKLLSIKVDQEIEEVEALFTFTDTWGSNDSTYSAVMSDICEGYAVGDKVKITAVFDKAAKVKMMADGCDDYFTDGSSQTVVWEITSTGDSFSMQAADAGQIPLHLLSVEIEVLEKGEGGGDNPPDYEVIHTFSSAWTGFDAAFTDYKADYEAGKETTVTLTFDKPVGAQIYHHGTESNPAVSTANGTEIKLTFIPSDDYMSIQLTDMAGNEEVKLLGIKVEQESSGEEQPESDDMADMIQVECLAEPITGTKEENSDKNQ